MSNNETPNEEVIQKGVDEKNKAIQAYNPTSTPTVTSQDFSSVEYAVAQLENINRLAEVFVKGALCPLKNVSDITIAIITGNQLGLPFMTSINSIYPINGKPAMSTHLIRALLLQKGITIKKDFDFEPMFAFYEGEIVEGKLVAKKIKTKNNAGQEIEIPVQRGIAPISLIDTTKYVVGNKEVDRITQFTFERRLRQEDGTYKDMTVVSRFTMQDATRAGLTDKDNWIKYPPRMLDARASMVGSREIASDILFGMQSISELADANNIKYTMNENLEETIDTEVEIVQ